jgi:hypothetical protein
LYRRSNFIARGIFERKTLRKVKTQEESLALLLGFLEQMGPKGEGP